MYTPPAFVETDLTRLHDFIERHSFATLISSRDGEPVASQLPLLLDREAGAQGRLIGHMARANSHWRTAADQRALAIYHGPHAYVSPGWIEAQNVVPTWNYAAVHAYGTLRLVDDRDRLRDILQRTVSRYESNRERPWSMALPDEGFIEKLIAAIVGSRSTSIGSKANGSSARTIHPSAASRSCEVCGKQVGTTNCKSPR